MRHLITLCLLGLLRLGQWIAPSLGLAATRIPAASAVPLGPPPPPLPDAQRSPKKFPVPGGHAAATSDAADAPDEEDSDDSGDYEYVYEDAEDDDDEDADAAADDDYDYEYNDRDALFENFNCDAILYGHGATLDDPVSDVQLENLRQQWEAIRETYAAVKNSTRGEYDALNPFQQSARDPGHVATDADTCRVSGMRVPIRVGDGGPLKGRGVFATAPIPNGTLVVDLDNGSTGFFKKRRPWRQLAESLPNETACNLLEWSFIQNLPPSHDGDRDPRNGLTIFIAFDESNLMNNADWDGVKANVRCGLPPKKKGGKWGSCRLHYYASRDIAAGEELLISYGEFEDATQQGWFDIVP